MRKNKLFGLIGAFAMAAAGFAVLGSAHENKVHETEAGWEEKSLYVAIETDVVSSYTVKLNCNRGGDTGGYQWASFDMSRTGNTYQGMPVYSGSYWSYWGGLNTLQVQFFDGNSQKRSETIFDGWKTDSEMNGKIVVFSTHNFVDASFDGTYSVQIGTSSYNMSYDKNAGQYKAENINLNVEDTVSFKCGASSVTFNDGNKTNLCDHKILVAVSKGGLYLKKESGNYVAYVTGFNLTDRQFEIAGIRYSTEEKTDASPHEFVLKNIEINENDTIKAAFTNGRTYDLYIQKDARHVDFNYNDSNLVSTCKTHGIYNLYLKSEKGIDYDFFYVDYAEDFKAAFNFVNNSVDSIKSICKIDGSTSRVDIGEAWADMQEEYGKLNDTAKEYILNNETNFKFAEFYYEYDLVEEIYGFNNFLDRESSSSLKVNPLITTNNIDNSIWIISAIALTGLTAIGGYFFYRKRREN